MASPFAEILTKADEFLTSILSEWNIYSTLLLGIIVAVVIGSLFLSPEPDTHPLLLARQSNVSNVRQPGESGSYRHLSIYSGQPLVPGLEVRDEGTPAYKSGRSADLRDLLRRAATGDGVLYTVLGNDPYIKHSWADVVRSVNAISGFLQKKGAKRVAIHLPNNLENLEAIFACAFAGITPILLPRESSSVLVQQLAKCNADFLITTAGSINLGEVVSGYSSLKHILWVVPKASRHMDYEHVPEGVGGQFDVSVWHDVVSDASVPADLPANDSKTAVPSVSTFWQGEEGVVGELVTIPQKNLLAGVAAVITSLPPKERYNKDDVFLTTDHLSYSYAFVHTLAALYSQASILLVAAASRQLDIHTLVLNYSINPTVLLSSKYSLSKLQTSLLTGKLSLWDTVRVSLRMRSLQLGHLVKGPINADAGKNLTKLRLLYATHPIDAEEHVALSEKFLQLRTMLGAQVIYVLTSKLVAGPVAQSGVYDYRSEKKSEARFGSPCTTVELKLKDHDEHVVDDDKVRGMVYVSGPAVLAEGEASLGVVGEIHEDHTLGLLEAGR